MKDFKFFQKQNTSTQITERLNGLYGPTLMEENLDVDVKWFVGNYMSHNITYREIHTVTSTMVITEIMTEFGPHNNVSEITVMVDYGPSRIKYNLRWYETTHLTHIEIRDKTYYHNVNP